MVVPIDNDTYNGGTKSNLCTYNVVVCFDWVKGCRRDIPLENLDFGIIAPPVETPWYIYIYKCVMIHKPIKITVRWAIIVP